MKIWKLWSKVDEYDNLIPQRAFTADEIQAFDGRKMKATWTPLQVKRMEPEKGLELSDAPGFTIPVFSRRALEVLRPLIKDSVEELELLFAEREYWGINVTTVLNVIDYSKSQYRMYSDGKRIMVFEKYAFRQCDEIVHNHIFKVVDEPRRKAFVSDEFRKVVEDNKLSGFHFELVWDSEQE